MGNFKLTLPVLVPSTGGTLVSIIEPNQAQSSND